MKPCITARYEKLLVQQMRTTDFTAWLIPFQGALCLVPLGVCWSWIPSACSLQMDRYCIVSTRQCGTCPVTIIVIIVIIHIVLIVTIIIIIVVVVVVIISIIIIIIIVIIIITVIGISTR